MAVATQPTAAWEELAHRVDARPFFHPGWFDAWWRAFGRGRPRVLETRRDGRLTGVFPLATDRLGLTGQANWHSPEFGMLAESADDRAELAATAFDERPARLRIPLLDRHESGLDELRDEAEHRGYRVVERVQSRSPYISLEGSFDDFTHTIQRTHRKDLERRRRRLDEQGGLELDLVEGGGREELDAALAEGLPVEGSGWKVEKGTAIVCDPALVRFYTELAHWAARERMLLLAFLRVGGRPVAFDYMLRDAHRVYGLKIGYDREFARWSPGILLGLALWERLFAEDGVETYEMCGNLDQMKLRWRPLVRDRVLFQAFAPTPLGRAALAAEVVGRPAAKRALAFVRR